MIHSQLASVFTVAGGFDRAWAVAIDLCLDVVGDVLETGRLTPDDAG
ncbi:hypothetical protein ACF08B_36205 [Streptomyces sp. NPDC015139]